MHKIVFVTFHDPGAMGVRLLSALARERMVDSHIVFFKEGKEEIPIWFHRNQADFSFYEDGIYYGSPAQVEKATAKEMGLLLDYLIKVSPDLLCISTRSYGIDLAREVVHRIRAKLSALPIVCGGWGPTLEPEKFLSFCDYVCRGEGEKTFIDIINRLNESRTFEGVKNLVYRKLNGIHYEEMYAPLTVAELNSLPFPDLSDENKILIHNDRLLYGHEFYQASGHVFLAGRGCPLSCSYCQSGQYQLIYQKMGHACPKLRVRDAEVVINEIEYAKQKGLRYVIMRDEVFPFGKEWVEEFLRLYKERIDLPMFAYIRPEFHSETVIQKLHDIGLRLTRVGIQSGSDEILEKVYHRKLKKQAAVRFAQMLDKTGIDYSYHMIYKNPFETEAHLREGFRFCCGLPFKSLRIFSLVIHPKSLLEQMILEARPIGLSSSIQDWYAILCCLAIKGRLLRSIAKFVEERGLFRFFPYIMELLLWPNYWIQHWKKRKA